jgi:hypothetical protein
LDGRARLPPSLLRGGTLQRRQSAPVQAVAASRQSAADFNPRKLDAPRRWNGQWRLSAERFSVAQTSKSAVSQVSKPAGGSAAGRLGSLRHSRFGNLRHTTSRLCAKHIRRKPLRISVEPQPRHQGERIR